MSANPRERGMQYFMMLTHDEQRAAILRLARSGMSINTISSATKLAPEFVRTVVGNPAGMAISTATNGDLDE